MPVAARFAATVHTCPGAHLISCKMDTGSLYRGKSGRVVEFDHRLKKKLSYFSTSLLGLRGILWVNFIDSD
jgi:hypothetical protein